MLQRKGVGNSCSFTLASICLWACTPGRADWETRGSSREAPPPQGLLSLRELHQPQWNFGLRPPQPRADLARDMQTNPVTKWGHWESHTQIPPTSALLVNLRKMYPFRQL